MHMLRLKLFTAVLLWSVVTHPFTGRSFMTYRSQEQNLARNVSGWQSLRTDIFNGHALGNVSVAVEGQRSFDAQAINRYFFGSDCLTFSGSRIANRGPCDILADYFGLPTDFQSSVCFDPKVRNIITDLDFYWNLDCLFKGFNLHVNTAIVSSKWELNPCETVINPGVLAYPAGYMSRDRIDYDDLQKGALGVLSCGQTFGDLAQPLQYGRIAKNGRHATKLSDILVAVGYTFVRDCTWLFGVNAQVIIPTGTRSQACYLFEPQIGNGHHWALGFGLTARYDIIDNEACDLKVSACLDAAVQHLFKATEKRSYDLKQNGPGSRYMLLEDMVGPITNSLNFSPVPLTDLFAYQYDTRLLYVIDATTFDSTIKINAQTDIVLKLTADYGCWNFDLGYNFWGRSAESLVCRGRLNHKYYGVKGDAQLYGFINTGGPIALPLPINATQSTATVHAPQGNGNTTNNFVNANADNPAFVYNVGSPVNQTDLNSLVDTGVTGIAPVNGSNQAIVLSDQDINDCSGLSPRAFSNKIFGSAGYTWSECDCVTPYVALGGEGEFAGKDDCVKTAISQWGIWIKGGFNY